MPEYGQNVQITNYDASRLFYERFSTELMDTILYDYYGGGGTGGGGAFDIFMVFDTQQEMYGYVGDPPSEAYIGKYFAWAMGGVPNFYQVVRVDD